MCHIDDFVLSTRILIFNIICRLRLSVFLSFMDAQTVQPIVPKFGMGIQEHLEIAIGYVLCTWVQGGRREGRRKGGGQIGLMLLA